MPSATAPPHILISGGGPSGLFLALILAQHAQRSATQLRITILESQNVYPDIPKAYAYLPVLFPDFKAAGIYDDLAAAAAKQVDTGIYFRLAADAEKRVIAETPKAPGMPGPLLLSQKEWLEIVKRRLVSFRGESVSVDVRMGCEVLDVAEVGSADEDVRVRVRSHDGGEDTLSATYLVGADGSKSTVRKSLGISFEGETLPQQLVATDVYYPFDMYGWDGANFMVDENYYGMIGPIDGKGLWRVSFGMSGKVQDAVEEKKVDGHTIVNGESKGQANGKGNGQEHNDRAEREKLSLDEIHGAVSTWFNEMFPKALGSTQLKEGSDYTLDKVAAYRAQQLCATNFRKGRCFLIGDAAHLTNPYIGMGLATGLLDAVSLAPVLHATLHDSGGTDDKPNAASEKLLDAWATARKNTFQNVIDPLSRAAFASVQDPDAESFPQRHPMLKRAVEALRKGEKMSPPPVRTSVEGLEGWDALVGAAR